MTKKALTEQNEKEKTDLHGAAIINPNGSETATNSEQSAHEISKLPVRQ